MFYTIIILFSCSGIIGKTAEFRTSKQRQTDRLRSARTATRSFERVFVCTEQSHVLLVRWHCLPNLLFSFNQTNCLYSVVDRNQKRAVLIIAIVEENRSTNNNRDTVSGSENTLSSKILALYGKFCPENWSIFWIHRHMYTMSPSSNPLYVVHSQGGLLIYL